MNELIFALPHCSLSFAEYTVYHWCIDSIVGRELEVAGSNPSCQQVKAALSLHQLVVTRPQVSLVKLYFGFLFLVCKTAVKILQTEQVRHGCKRDLIPCRYPIPPIRNPTINNLGWFSSGGYFNLCYAGTLSPPNSTANWQPPLWAAIKVIGLDSRNHFHWPLGQRFGSGRKAAAEQHAEGCFYHKPLLRSDEIRCLFAGIA